MRSVVLFTEEIDDLDEAMFQLKQQFAGFELGKSTAGVVFAHPDTDFEELTRRLKEELGVPFIGSSAMALLTPYGFKTEGIIIQIYTADDCLLQIGTTGEIDAGTEKAAIESMYKELKSNITDREHLILTYGNLPIGMAGDDCVEILNSLSEPDTVIYGGLASDEFSRDDCRVFCGEQIIHHGLAVLVISGRLRPFTRYQFTVANLRDYDAKATEVEGTKVKKLNGVKMADAIQAAGFSLINKETFGEYVSFPFRVTYTTEDGDEIQYMRHLAQIDETDGAGVFLGKVPKGAQVEVALVSRKDIHDSVAAVAKESLRKVLGTADYTYSSVLVTSCASRLMSYSREISRETTEYVSLIPEGISMCGFYSFGEFCPAESLNTHKNINSFHNATFTMLVM